MACEQSTAPEHTMAARQEGLTNEDFQDDQPERRCLTSEQILSAEDRGHLDNWVPTPEWTGPGAGVYVRTPSGEDRERYERQEKLRKVKVGKRTVQRPEMNRDQLRERLMIGFACNDEGTLLFACGSKEETRETVNKLRKKAAIPIGRIGDRVIELMGWSESDIEELVGNSDGDQS